MPFLSSVDDSKISDDEERDNFNSKRELLLFTAKNNLKLIESLLVAQQPDEIIKIERPDVIEVPSLAPIDIESTQTQLEKVFDTVQGKIVVISKSHISTYAEIHAALKNSRENENFPENGKVGLIVFDEHTDFYRKKNSGIPEVSRNKQLDFSSTDLEKNQREYSWSMAGMLAGKPLDVGKKNFLMHLLEEEAIHQLCIIGPTKKSKRLTTEKIDPNDETFDYYIDRTEKISIFSYEDFLDEKNKSLQRSRFLEKIVDQVKIMKEKGITHILFSVDLDVLRSELGYTGFEYNAHAFLANLGVQDIRPQFEVLKKELQSKKYNNDEELIKIDQFLNSVLFSRQNSSQEIEIEGNVKPKEVGGLPAGFIGQTLDAIKKVAQDLEVDIGLQLTNGLFVGDVVELNGRDVGGYTTRMALAIADRMGRD